MCRFDHMLLPYVHVGKSYQVIKCNGTCTIKSLLLATLASVHRLCVLESSSPKESQLYYGTILHVCCVQRNIYKYEPYIVTISETVV